MSAYTATINQYRKFSSDAKKALATLIIVVLTPFLVFSETTIKSLLDNWLNSCTVVIEKRAINEKQIEVIAYPSGTLPKKLPFTFRARDALIQKITFNSLRDDHRNDAYARLGFHPDQFQTCPGILCEGQRLGSGAEPVANIDLADLSDAFTYRFVVDLERHGTARDVDVFVIFDRGLKDGVCAIESANAFNFVMRSTKLVRFWLFVAVFLVFTVAIQIFRKRRDT